MVTRPMINDVTWLRKVKLVIPVHLKRTQHIRKQLEMLFNNNR